MYFKSIQLTDDVILDVAREEMTRTLLLILGCAIQSEMKEIFIENIKSLDIEIQHAIMEYIKEVS